MKKEHIKLSAEDQSYIEELLSVGEQKARTYKRALALLELSKGRTYKAVSAVVGVRKQTVSDWAKKYRTEGLTFLEDKSRSGRPVILTGDQRAKITSLACSEAPEGHARWTLVLLADKSIELGFVDQVSPSTVGLMLKKTSLSPT